MLDEKLLDAAVAALQEVSWHELTLERVAAAAGVSRVTLWRQGVTLEHIVEGLLTRLTESYRSALWPILTAEGTGRERLLRALQAICDVADRHMPLLASTDTVFHEARDVTGTGFSEPLERLLRDGIADGSIRHLHEKEIAPVLFNTVCWTYVHLRARHQMSANHARSLLLDLVLHGLVPAPEHVSQEH